MPGHIIHGFSKLSRSEKLNWLRDQELISEVALEHLNGHLHPDHQLQGIYEEISENTVSNYYLPLGLAWRLSCRGIGNPEKRPDPFHMVRTGIGIAQCIFYDQGGVAAVR